MADARYGYGPGRRRLTMRAALIYLHTKNGRDQMIADGLRRLGSMTAGHAHEELHHLVDRLSPNQARRLLRLVKTDPELAEATDEQPDEPVRRRRLSIAGIGASGEGDLSERVEDLLAERFNQSM
jgi:hypothetical protein